MAALHLLRAAVTFIEEDRNQFVMSSETVLDALFAAFKEEELKGRYSYIAARLVEIRPESAQQIEFESELYEYLKTTSLASYRKPLKRGDPDLLVPPEIAPQLEADIKRKMNALFNAPSREHAKVWGPGFALVLKKSLQITANTYDELLPSVDLETASEFDPNALVVASLLTVGLKTLSEDSKRKKLKRKDREIISTIAIDILFLFALVYFYNLN